MLSIQIGWRFGFVFAKSHKLISAQKSCAGHLRVFTVRSYRAFQFQKQTKPIIRSGPLPRPPSALGRRRYGRAPRQNK